MLTKIQRWEHSPRLNTVIMVEDTLRNMDESTISMGKLKKILPKKINHNTLKIILQYLEESNKIAVSMKGISWIHNSHPGMKRAIKEGTEL